MISNAWLDKPKDDVLLLSATLADTKRIKYDQRRMELNAEAAFDAGFEAGVVAQEAGLGRYSD